jgi:hypothetical protein
MLYGELGKGKKITNWELIKALGIIAGTVIVAIGVLAVILALGVRVGNWILGW